MKIENLCIYGLYPAILGVRNSYKSTDKSDSKQQVCLIKASKGGEFGPYFPYSNDDDFLEAISSKDIGYPIWYSYNHAIIGENDMKLLKALSKRRDEYGEAERKFLRQIFVGADISGSLKFYAQFDTYKIATVRNSESSMHSLTIRPIEQSDFERNINPQQIDYCNKLIEDWNYLRNIRRKEIIDRINIKISEIGMRAFYLNTTNMPEFKEEWELMNSLENDIEIVYADLDANLPAGYVLKSYWTGNYEVLRKIYKQRKKHKMYWWKQFCEVIEKLPYAKEFIIGE